MLLSLALATLAPPQPHRLTVLLQLRNELITLLDDVVVLLILVVRSIRLDDAFDAIDRARDAVRRDELGEIPKATLVCP